MAVLRLGSAAVGLPLVFLGTFVAAFIGLEYESLIILVSSPVWPFAAWLGAVAASAGVFYSTMRFGVKGFAAVLLPAFTFWYFGDTAMDANARQLFGFALLIVVVLSVILGPVALVVRRRSSASQESQKQPAER